VCRFLLLVFLAPAVALAAGAAPLDTAPWATPDLTDVGDTMAQVVDQVRPAVVMVHSKLVPRRSLAELFREANPHLSAGAQTASRDWLREAFEGRLDSHLEYLLSVPGLLPLSEAIGSGVIVDTGGLVITNAHLVEDYNVFYVSLLDKSEYPARVVGIDTPSDLALLEIVNAGQRRFTHLPLGLSASLRIGELVLAVGTPFEPELAQSVSAGIVSALGRRGIGVADYENFIQTDCAINTGNSGGPLVNLRGELVGVNTAIATLTGEYSGVGFAIPVDQAARVAERLLSEGRVHRAFLGVLVIDVDSSIAAALALEGATGALVSEVNPDSPAAQAGLHPYDVITACDGVPTENANALRNQISSCDVGRDVTIELVRDGETLDAVVQLTELADELSVPPKDNLDRVTPPPSVSPQSFGIEVGDLDPEIRKQIGLDPVSGSGVVITKTTSGSYAAHLELYPGTRVIEANQVPIQSAADFTSLIQNDLQDVLLLRVQKVAGSQEIVALRRGQ
jgi:serine protease Do